jgi:hypothetical protein
VQVYALTSSQSPRETLDLFLTWETADAELCEILQDEPEWKDVLRIVPIELDGRTFPRTRSCDGLSSSRPYSLPCWVLSRQGTGSQSGVRQGLQRAAERAHGDRRLNRALHMILVTRRRATRRRSITSTGEHALDLDGESLASDASVPTGPGGPSGRDLRRDRCDESVSSGFAEPPEALVPRIRGSPGASEFHLVAGDRFQRVSTLVDGDLPQ